MKPVKRCDLCEHKQFHFLLESRDTFHGVPGRFKYFKCNNCGLIFINPLPGRKEVTSFYPKKYYFSRPKLLNNSLKNKVINLIYKTYYSDSGNLFLKIVLFPLKVLPPLGFEIRRTRIVEGGNFLQYVPSKKR